MTIITAFIWSYAITNPGVNALRTPVYAEMVNLVLGKKVAFSDYKFNENTLKTSLYNFGFFNGRPITKSMLAWWAFSNDSQELLSLETTLEIEHIYARKRNEIEHSLNNSKNIDALGNKALLEKTVNIRAADYRFVDKIKYYKGYVNDKGQTKEGTNIYELASFVGSRIDFSEADIEKRNHLIIDSFIEYVRNNNLIEND